MANNYQVFKRQVGIFNPDETNGTLGIVHIFGLGTVGSTTALCLTKMGISKLSIYDFDKVEEHNIPSQLYSLSDVSKLKVDVLSKMLLHMAPYNKNAILVFNNAEEITEQTNLDYINKNDIIILAFDSLKARKTIYDKVKAKDVWIIDGRMLGEMFSIFTVKPSVNAKEYEQSLDGKPFKGECGVESISYNAFTKHQASKLTLT
jgi:tRNA A37 threonylcarbamoyladenosine dehydratase